VREDFLNAGTFTNLQESKSKLSSQKSGFNV
jgi:hypothetical protein